MNPDLALAYMNRGVAKGRIGHNEEAILDYSKAIELDSSDACSFRNRGAANARMKRFDYALADLDTAINLRSRFDEAYTARGVVKMQLQQYRSAIDDFYQAISMKGGLDTGSKIEMCPVEPEHHFTPTPGPTPTPNPCPTECFSKDEARYIQTYLWRGYAHYYLGNNRAALIDLRIALELAWEYGDYESAESAQNLINIIK